MATQALFIQLGEPEFGNDGELLRLGAVEFYVAQTTTPATTYSNPEGTASNANPVPLDANGRYPTAIYLTDTSVYPAGYKMVVKNADGVVIRQMDDIPATTPLVTTTQFAAELTLWQQITNAQSPVTLLSTQAGNAYEADSSAGAIVFNLPSAASVGNGHGFIFKKTAAANTVTINRAGSDTIDGDTSVILYGQYTGVKISSNGASWRVDRYFQRNLSFVDRRSGTSGGGASLAAPASGTSLAGPVTIDVTGNSLRIFEDGGTSRGVSIDLSTTGASVAGAIFHDGIAASQAQMETATSVGVPVTPGRQHFHPGHSKAGGSFNGTGTPAFRAGDYGMGAITDNGAGNYTLAFDTSFANTNFWWAGQSEDNLPLSEATGARASSSLHVLSGAGTDRTLMSVALWGDYA